MTNPLRSTKHFLQDHWSAMLLAAVLTTAAWIYGPVRHVALRDSASAVDWRIWAIAAWEYQWLLPVMAVVAMIVTLIPRALARRQPEMIKLQERLFRREREIENRGKDLDTRAADLEQQAQELQKTRAQVEAWGQQYWDQVGKNRAEMRAEDQAIRTKLQEQEQALNRRAADLDRQGKDLKARETALTQAQAELAQARQDAEAQAQQTVTDARAQAGKIIDQAQTEAAKITDREMLARRIAEREAEIETRERDLEAQAGEVENLRATVNRRNRDIQQAEQDLKARTTALTEREQEMARTVSDTLAQAQQIITDTQARAEALDRRESQLQALAGDLTQRGRDLAERESRLQALASDLDRREQDMTEWEQDLSNREADLDIQTQDLLSQTAPSADDHSQQPQHQVSQAEQRILDYLCQHDGTATRRALVRLCSAARLGRLLDDLCHRGLITVDDGAEKMADWTYRLSGAIPGHTEPSQSIPSHTKPSR
ncbi:MAG: hypothetical protein PHW74_03710 [Desulfobacca sp.]|nr:hypothetical protein [Desulfobacca sp.]